MKLFVTTLITVIGVVSSFLGLFHFFTAIDDIQELKAVIAGKARTTIVSSESPGEDPEVSMLNVNASDPLDGGNDQLVCTLRVDGEEIASTPVEALPIRPGRHSISLLRKGYIGENLKVESKPGTSLALAIRMFPNTADGVTRRNAYLAKLAKFANIEVLRGVVRVVNVSLFVGWLVIASALVIGSGFDFDVIKFVGYLTLVPIIAIALAPMFVDPLLSLLKNPILTVALASVTPIVVGVVALFQKG